MVLLRWYQKGQWLRTSTSQKLFLVQFWQHITWLCHNISTILKLLFLVLNFLIKTLQKKKDVSSDVSFPP